MNVSVIIPTYNEAKNIGDCINSLLKQQYPDFEIIVVDDGSTDDTETILRSFTPENKKVIILNQSHFGAGEARNLGAKSAKGDILVFVDADMTFEKVFLRKLVAPIISGKAIGTFSKEEYVSNWNNIWARCWNWNLNLPNRKRLPSNYPNQQKVFRAILKSKFRKAGGFSPGGYTDDWTLSEKLGETAALAEGARFFHRNPDSLREVFVQSRWSAKRKYKAGFFGVIIALLRSSLPITLMSGVIKSLIHADIRFLLFKVVYDLGQTVGIVSYYVTKKGSK